MSTAVVTGSGRGLGRSFALRLAADGYAVAVLDRDLHSYHEFEPETERSTVDEIAHRGGTALGLPVDVVDRAGVLDAFATIAAELGDISVVVCNAGGGTGGVHDNRAGTLDEDSLDAMIRLNLFGTVNCCVAAAPYLVARGAGSIITMSSVNGVQPTPDGAYAHYGTAKAAVAMYTRYLAQDLGPRGVRANAIAPGLVTTGRLRQKWAATGEDPSPGIPLRRLAGTEDVASVVSFLASDASAYLTGQVIVIDGGWTR